MTLPIRNVAIIAHVDHGKTTLVDGLLKQSGVFQDHQVVSERVMDSMDLEKERGITISAKNCSLEFEGTRINLVDTPGHADFGGEVERSLMMVDGAILLVDAAEGPLPQTRFVLQKALQRGISMILVINKVDRPDARVEEVEELVSDLFLELSDNEAQLDFPILYASGRQGWCTDKRGGTGTDLSLMFHTMLRHVPPPQVPDGGSSQFLINHLSYNSYLGRVAIGRMERGQLTVNQAIVILGENGKSISARVTKLRVYRGLQQTDIESVSAGDIVMVATGVDDLNIGDTIADALDPQALPRIQVDPPTVSVEVSVNTSPLAGQDGTYLTSRKVYEFLQKEALFNVSLKVSETDSPEVFILSARGELQVSIVIENLRRAGGECMVGRPKVITKVIDGQHMEPIERVIVDIPENSVGAVTETLSGRQGRMVGMENPAHGRVRLEFTIPTRGLLGYRSTFLTITKGEGLMSSYFEAFEALKPQAIGRSQGALISDRSGVTTEYALSGLEDRGRLFIPAGDKVYEGMVIGEHNRENDLDVNPCREKKLTNMRSSGTDESTKLSPVTKFSLERALDWIKDDEWIEVTPKNIRVRTRVLEAQKR